MQQQPANRRHQNHTQHRNGVRQMPPGRLRRCWHRGNHTRQSLLNVSAQPGLPRCGRRVVVHGAALDWLSSQAARCRMAAAPWQPEGPDMFARRATSSLSCVSTYTPSLLLAQQANRSGAGHAETLNRLLVQPAKADVSTVVRSALHHASASGEVRRQARQRRSCFDIQHHAIVLCAERADFLHGGIGT